MGGKAGIRVLPVRGRKALNLFVELPYRLHEVEGMWVPPPRRDVRMLLDRNRHPFHEHAQVEYFLARRDGECVGRIAAIENHAHNQAHGERVGFFGFLDAEQDEEVFAALLGEAERWAAARGLKALRGPCSFSTNEECGALVHGFMAPPAIMTPWNTETYPRLIESAGYTKARDLISWWVWRDTLSERMVRVAGKLLEKLQRGGRQVTARHLNMKDFGGELSRVRRVYNSAWEKNWGFVPMTEAEIEHMARELRRIVVPELVQFVEVDGEPVAFSLTLPDYNIALRFMEGRMGPRQIATFLLLRKHIHHCRMMALGVVEEFRNRGLEALLISETIKAGRQLGYTSAELGWILEDNDPMNRAIASIGAVHHKTHRIYEKTLLPGTPA